MNQEIYTLIKRLKDLGAKIYLENNEIRLNISKEKLTDDIKDAIKLNRNDLILFLGRDKYIPIPHVPTENVGYILSSSQKRLWILSQFEDANLAYNMTSVYELNGKLDVDALEFSIINLINRHEILRTIFKEDDDGEIKQFIKRPNEFEFKIKQKDLRDTPNKHARLNDYIKSDFSSKIDLTNGPLLVVNLYQIEDNSWIFNYVMHHIISDGWSMQIFIKELFAFYKSYSQSTENLLKPLKLQYKDYALWQQNRLTKGDFNLHKEYWLKKFDGELPVLDLSAEKIRPVIQTYRGNSIQRVLNRKVSEGIMRINSTYDCTLFMSLIAFLKILIYKYSNQTDIIIGSPIAGREHPDLDEQIGVYINTLPLRTIFRSDDSFVDLIGNVRTTTLEAYDHQSYPFDELLNNLSFQRNLSRNALFDIMLILHNASDKHDNVSSSSLNEIKFKNWDSNNRELSRLDLTFDFIQLDNDDIKLSLEYNTDIYSGYFVESLISNLEELVLSVIGNPTTKLCDLNYLNEADKNKILFEFNNTYKKFAPYKSVIELIGIQVQKRPTDVAIIFEDKQLTYSELNRISDQLAGYLIQHYNIKKNDVVGIKLPRSEWMIITILAILKSGGAYLPIDVNVPQERLAYIQNDSNCKILFDNQELNKFLNDQHNYNGFESNTYNSAEDAAYVMYTSGSTGQPNGVIIEHQNLSNFIFGMTDYFGVESGNFLSLSNYTFDISILEFLWTLTLGYKVVLQNDVLNVFANDEHSRIDFSLFYFGNSTDDNELEKYKLVLNGSKYADENGYKAIWTPERHFNEFGGLYPNPSVLGAALATITKNIAIRAGSVVLPLHNPIRVAEEWSVVDNLSNGRVGIGFASGWHPDDFVFFPNNYDRRHSIMYDSIELLRKLWKGESIEVSNGSELMKEIKIYPTPIQRELPIWITSAGSIETFISAGTLGLNILTHLIGESVEELELKIKAYRSAYLAAGHKHGNGSVVLMLHTYIDDDLETAFEKSRIPFINYLKSSLGLLKKLAADLNFDMDSANFSEDDMNTLLEDSFKRYITSASLIGTEETCTEMLKRISKIGVDEVACFIDFGIDYDSAIESLSRLTKLKESYNGIQSTKDYSLHTQLKKHEITHLQTTPSIASVMGISSSDPSIFSSVKKILLGGEKLPINLINDIYNKLPSAEIYNMYGPTETTIWSTCSRIERNSPSVSIGKPIVNTQIYILNENLQLLPIGVRGEIYIGGKGVSRGYLNRDTLTSERFLENPYVKNSRLYKTGDFGLWLKDGSIEYIGRVDDQVKLRGQRIELGEIESLLCSHNTGNFTVIDPLVSFFTDPLVSLQTDPLVSE